ncbi:hypothetical protein S7335_323 [Synechococcus sp. PCC 7335]|nr:hypothetical protein S7335_323 [Synechococcus sp. PCC 7335]
MVIVGAVTEKLSVALLPAGPCFGNLQRSLQSDDPKYDQH